MSESVLGRRLIPNKVRTALQSPAGVPPCSELSIPHIAASLPPADQLKPNLRRAGLCAAKENEVTAQNEAGSALKKPS